MMKSPKNVLINVPVILKELPKLMVVKKNVWILNFYIQLILVEKLNIIVLSPARIWQIFIMKKNFQKKKLYAEINVSQNIFTQKQLMDINALTLARKLVL